ncbi:MAG TPA: sulfonate ABC transporter permease [Legionellales bacterium]|nr:sulfonate ABC transporter permease [Legionellales bacterium]
MRNSRFYFANLEYTQRILNRWDWLLLILVLALLFFFAWTGKQMALPYRLGEPLLISLSPKVLPFYALRTVLRMFIALGISVIFTLIIGTLAAKNKRAETVIIPAIDVLQAVPVLSFLSITVTAFIHLFPNSLLGPECASIFAIFTAQVWNITFGFYQSLKTLPHDLKEASAIFQLSAWQRFWKVEVPFAMPGLIWNMMMSMSASWFFVVLSEAIEVAHQDIRLPGVGSYIALAIEQHDLMAVGYAILTMMAVIFLYDQILFRPLIAWSEKFKMHASPDEQVAESWLMDLLRNSRLIMPFNRLISALQERVIQLKWLSHARTTITKERLTLSGGYRDTMWRVLVWGSTLIGAFYLSEFILSELKFRDIGYVLLLGGATGLRVLVLILLSSLIWIPIGVWVGLRPRVATRLQPIIQLVAAFPANLFYPLFVIGIVTFKLNVEIWVTPLMILGTQWYILFNVIAGATTIPQDLYLAADNLGLKGFLWWKRLALPGIFPFYITGAITAAGGAWNASIVAEWVSWGDVTLKATGLGAYIQAATLAGDFPKIALGTSVMCLYVLAFNHLIWRPLYRLAEERFNLN